MNPLIPNQGTKNLWENPEIISDTKKDDANYALERDNSKGKTKYKNDKFMEGFNMKKFNETDLDAVDLALKLEAEDRENETGNINFVEIKEDITEEPQEISELEPDNEKNIDENQEKENQILLEKFKNHPSFPILERFMNIEVGEGKKMTLLTEPDLLKLSQHLGSGENPVSGLREGIKGIVFDDDRTQTVLNNYLYTVENINDSIKPDGEGLFPLPEEFKGEKYSILNEDLDNDIVQLLIKNYTKFPDGEDGNPDIDKDIFTSCEVTLNKIIENKNFPQTKEYDKAVFDIRNGDLKTRIEGLIYINSLVNTQEGLKGGKANLSFKNIKKADKLKNESTKIFSENQKQKDLNNKVENKKSQGEQEDLLVNSNEENISDGEVFSGDITIEGIGDNTKNIGENR